MNKIYTQNYLITLIKCAIYDSIVPMPSSEIDWNYLYELSCKHRISPLIYFALDKLPNNAKNHIPQWDKYVFIYKQQLVDDANRENEINLINDALNKNKIDHIFLKGSITKYMYPNTVMRSMSDIDIFYRNSDEQNISNIFNGLGYKILKKEPKEIVFGKEIVRVKIEMQSALIDDGYFEWKKYLDTVWDNVISSNKYSYSMTDEMFYLYHIIHLAKHFKNSGIGLMHIIDTWILSKKLKINRDYVDRTLNSLSLIKFEKSITLLIDYWFNNYSPTDEENGLIQSLSNYIYSSGAFGNKQQSTINSSINHGDNKISFIKKLFPGKEVIANYYGKKAGERTILRPWYWIKLNYYRIKNSSGKTSINSFTKITQEQVEQSKDLFDILQI